ncbi:MAG: ParB/RepB/Spo0J family partition protein, partial [Candidatus Nitrosopolaris sp.]
DTPTATDSSHTNDEPQTSIMSIMSITSTTEASHSSLEESGYDQPTKFQEKSTDEIKDDTNDVSKNGHNGDAERPQITTEKEILNVNHVNYVTSPQRCSTNPSYNTGNLVDAGHTIMDVADLPSEKERERCKRELICGLRRIEAFKSLVKSEIPAHVVNLDDIVKGEISENTQRKDFSLEEIIQIKKAVEPEIKTESKKRKLSDKPASTKSFSNSANNIKTETDNSKPHQGSNLPSQPKSYTSTELCRHNPSSKLVNIFRHRLQTLQIMLTCLT